MEKLIQELGESLADSINGGYKFIKSKYSIVKKEDKGWKRITIDVLPASRPNFVKLALHAHIRIEELEKLYTPYHPFLSAKDARDHATISINCDQLFSDKSIVVSFEATKQSITETTHKYAKAIQIDILPFLDRFFSENALVSSLENENPKEWVTSDHLARYLILLSAYAQRNNWDLFEKIAHEFLQYCQKPHAQVYQSLADSVINGLLSGKSST